MNEDLASSLEPWPFKPSDEHGWPHSGRGANEAAVQAALDAKLEVRKQRTAEEIARAKAELDADLAVEHEYYKGLIEVAKSSVDRSRAAAESVQKAAGAIIAIYTGVLGISFSVSERPFPARGLYAALLLGVAIVLSTGFVAYLPDPGTYDEADRASQDDTPGESTPERLTNMFIRWARISSLDRAPWLRASVIALGFGLAFLPAPFISGRAAPSEPTQTVWPTPDPAAGTDIELRKILYEAQVERAATAKAIATEETYDTQWLAGFVLAVLLIIFLPHLLPGRLANLDNGSPEEREARPPPTRKQT